MASLIPSKGLSMETSWAKYLVIGVVALMVMLTLASVGRNRQPARRGWRHLKPGTLYHVAIAGGTMFTGFLAYIWLFVGSDRPDGESQMQILFWLIMAFGVGTIITLVQYSGARRMAMRWRGQTLVWHGQNGSEHCRSLSDTVGLRRGWTGWIYIVFDDGLEARIDPYTSNASALIETVIRLHSDDDGEEVVDLRP